jgi:hypothetical protein
MSKDAEKLVAATFEVGASVKSRQPNPSLFSTEKESWRQG